MLDRAITIKLSIVTLFRYLQRFDRNFERKIGVCTYAELSYRMLSLIAAFDIAASPYSVFGTSVTL